MSSLRDHIERTLRDTDRGLVTESEILANTGSITLPPTA